jgi:hypothetical protein
MTNAITLGFLVLAIVVGVVAAFAIMYADRAAARAHELAKELEAVRGDCIEWSRRALQAEDELVAMVRRPIVPRPIRHQDTTDAKTIVQPRLRPVPRHDGSH